MKEISPVALFRLSVLGALVSPEQLGRGELQTVIRKLAEREYSIPLKFDTNFRKFGFFLSLSPMNSTSYRGFRVQEEKCL